MEGSEWLLGWSLSPCPSEFLCPLSLSLAGKPPGFRTFAAWLYWAGDTSGR